MRGSGQAGAAAVTVFDEQFGFSGQLDGHPGDRLNLPDAALIAVGIGRWLYLSKVVLITAFGSSSPKFLARLPSISSTSVSSRPAAAQHRFWQ